MAPAHSPSPSTALDQVPRSWSGLLGLLGFVGGIASTWHLDLTPGQRTVLCSLAGGLPMMAYDLLVLRVHRRETAGIHAPVAPRTDWSRVGLKLVGLLATLGTIAVAYAVFREYHGGFYRPFWEVLKLAAAPFALLVVPYFAYIDRRMVAPRDGYWHMGALVAGPLFGVPRADVDRATLANHGRAWLVKAFFLPLMLVFMSQNLAAISTKIGSFQGVRGFIHLYDLSWLGLYTLDVAFAAVGYSLTLRLFDAHTRSAEPTMFGWALCVVCYQPFWGVAGRMFLNYDDGKGWGAWLQGMPVVQAVWGSAILLLTVVYVWATVTFGLRFSNLTHRGVLTFGPYRFVRHPAYLAKNLSWWLVAIPFIPTSGWAEALRACVALLLVNGVYALRAWTEERHLGRDAAYRAYQAQTPWWGARLAGWIRGS